jgi:Type II restriction endonuclease EcoO109I
MEKAQRDELLLAATKWFRETIVANHLENTKKLADVSNFNANPFLAPYLAVFLTGELTPHSVAKALVYPRVLGTSITTSFGTNIQGFISDVLGDAFGSTTKGVDIEFIDCVDGRKKMCQVKLGPNTINKDDIETIHGHFTGARRLARTNNSSVSRQDFVVGVVYGDDDQLSAQYKALRDKHEYDVFVGKGFWHRLTGSTTFYRELVLAISNVAAEADARMHVDSVINEIAASDLARKIAQVNER